MTHLRLAEHSPTAPGSVHEVVAWAIDDWLEHTAPTDDMATTWSSVDIAKHVMQCLERSGYHITPSAQ